MSYNLETLKVIDKIRFGLLSPEEIRKMSVGRIITADTYDEDGLPIKSGLMDSKLGTIEPGQKCATCGNRVGACPGHFGHIELARPVVHVGHAKLLLKILRGICHECGRVLLTEEQIEEYYDRQEKYIEIFDKPDETLIGEIFKSARKSKECPHCGAEKHKITIEKPTTFYRGGERLTPVDIRELLEKIPESDYGLFGINPETARPEWIILTVLPIPPVCVRPSITLDSGIRSEDDLTHKLVDVIRINQRLRENIDAGAPQLIVEDLWELLQYHVTTYFNNEVSGIPPARHRSGRALRTLTQRLKGKEGRFRSNLSGKRVDFSARTVISPNPHISLNQVGVPYKIAKILTVPSYVTEFNIEEMKQTVLNGPHTHPGANYIIREDGRRIDLRFVKNREIVASTIKPGFIIERHLRDGDLVLFNRQPSLHRMSIMAHEVKVMSGKTFRLSLVVCPPYNADFDGDEMNLHVPQSEEARTEAEYLLKVQEHIVSPRYGAPIIGAIQDFISIGYIFTRNERAPGVPNVYSRKDTFMLLYWGNVFRRNPSFSIKDLTPVNPEDPESEWKYTGKEIFSCILPHDLNMELKSKFYKDEEGARIGSDGYDVIHNGKMISGVIDKNLMGDGKSSSILHRIIRDYGPTRGRQFLDDFCGMMVWAITMTGLTMGIDEVDIGRARKDVHNKIYEAYDRAAELIKAYYEEDEEILPCAPGRTLYETLELNLMSLLNKVRGEAGNIASHFLGDTAHSVIMTKSGARGNPLNLAQMAACVGQQSVRQNRIHRGYIDRTLPHFKVKDLSPAARGFVLNSYRDGLTPTEFFFHAMGGREGLVDTAVRTSSSGYMQRRLVNALQDMVVENDLSVRTSENMVVQFKYGDDGIDPGRSDAGDILNFDQAILKTRSFKQLLEKEEKIAEKLDKASHPEFPVSYIKNITSHGFSVIEQIGESPTINNEQISQKTSSTKIGAKTTETSSEKSAKKLKLSTISDFEESDPSILEDEDWYRWYKLETKKNAIYHGNTTKLFTNWKTEKINAKRSISTEEKEEFQNEEIAKEVAEEEIKSSRTLADFSSLDPSTLSDEDLYQWYKLDTGKNAIYRGNLTKIFQKWKSNKIAEFESSSETSEIETEDTQTTIIEDENEVIEEEPEVEEQEIKSDLASRSFSSLSIEERYQLYNQETGKKAIVRGRATNIYKNWESKKMEEE
ncbi:MAG: DNA-directed RNA polymerase subunit A' [Candidatus Lokiarchaeota archaeon]|nr:DNA-directed RNA polymerase subunit A' [Candidatus Harpocratesius repetitus]